MRLSTKRKNLGLIITKGPVDTSTEIECLNFLRKVSVPTIQRYVIYDPFPCTYVLESLYYDPLRDLCHLIRSGASHEVNNLPRLYSSPILTKSIDPLLQLGYRLPGLYRSIRVHGHIPVVSFTGFLIYRNAFQTYLVIRHTKYLITF